MVVDGSHSFVYLGPVTLPKLIFFLLLTALPFSGKAYSILSHQAVIDAAWPQAILPQLKKKFPAGTDKEWQEAYAYAYGGSVAADMGYFPFGSALFSDLVHYVRSGDFVNTLIAEASTINEYAFALGFLSHYYADGIGHHEATNRCAPLLYDGVKKKFGAYVTYEQHPLSHGRTEFGFDVLQLARGAYQPEAYRNFIGFQVSKQVMERAFAKVYGLDFNQLFSKWNLALGSFRWAVRSLTPMLTRTAWRAKKDEIKQKQPGIHSRQFVYRMNRRAYYQQFGRERKKPGIISSVGAFVFRILPKVGPLKKYRFAVPDRASEALFIASFNKISQQYTQQIQRTAYGNGGLPNIDFDTNKLACWGEYGLANKTHSALLLQLKENNFTTTDAALKENLLSFFGSNAALSPSETEALLSLKQYPAK